MAEVGPGSRIGDQYVLERIAAEETLGTVWFARDARAGRAVRLKMLRRDHLLDDQRFRRFQREIEAFGRVSSPGLLPLLDTGVHDGLAYAVFAAVPERTLAQVVAEGALPWREAAGIALRLVVALAALHREGIVHRDLVGQNVLLDEKGQPWIRDLGLAWLVSTEDDTASLTGDEGRVGHLAAMAPEYLAQQQLTPGADLYALGVLTFAALTGEPPFPGQGNELVRATLGAVAPAPSSKDPDIPRWLDAVVGSLLEKDPGRRPSADAVLARLRNGLDGEGPGPAAPRRWPKVLGALAVGAVGVAGLAVVGPRLAAPARPQGLEPTASSSLPPTPEPPVEPAEEERWLLPPRPPSAPAAPRVVQAEAEARATAPEVVAARAALVVRANQRALVSLDGEPVGLTPLRIHALPGPHVLKVSLPARAETRQERKVVLVTREAREVSFVF